MRIQHNITALNAHRQLGINNTSVGKNLEKLSSGFRINRAGDDAAGLAISEKMRGQIRGLDMASNNAQDGISLIQTAEGNLQETHSILQRMRELAVQSSNGTFEDTNDRENLDKEVQALKAEVDRIANSAHFNNAKLLNGDLEKKVNTAATTDAVASKIATTLIDGAKGSDAVAAKYEIDLTGLKATTTSPTLTINGVAVSVTTTANNEVGGVNSAALMTSVETAYNASTDAAHIGFKATVDGNKLILTAKTAGALPSATDTEMKKGVSASTLTTGSFTKTASVKTAGSDAGAGSAAKAAAYKFQFDLDLIAGGQKFTLGDKIVEFTTDGTTSAGNVTNIDISAFDLKDAAGQKAAADAIKGDLATAFGGTFAVGNASTVDGDKKFTIEMVANVPGTGGNWGAIREDEGTVAMNGFVTGSQTTVGAAAGTAKPTIFATAELDIDFAKLKVGDKITLNGETFEAISGKAEIDTNAETKQFKLNDSNDETVNEGEAAANFIKAFELSGVTGSTAVGQAQYTPASAAGVTPPTRGKLTFTSVDASQKSEQFVAALGTFKFDPIEKAAGETTKGGVVFQIGANGTNDDRVSLTIEAQDSATLGIAGIDIKTVGGANAAIDLITDATNKVSGTRADLGALQNRLEHTVANLGTTSENLTAAESRIRDVDMAKEMMEMTKNNILSQAAQAMLAQANQQPQGILQLLR